MITTDDIYNNYTKVMFPSWFDMEEGDYVMLSLNQQGVSPECICGFIEKDAEDRALINGIALATLRYDWKTTEIWKKPVAKEPRASKLPNEVGYYLRNGKKLIRMRLQNTGKPIWERAEWITIEPDKVAELEMKLNCGLPIQKLVIEEK